MSAAAAAAVLQPVCAVHLLLMGRWLLTQMTLKRR
jgi:energy-converting hydrogenase Eha subunit C